MTDATTPTDPKMPTDPETPTDAASPVNARSTARNTARPTITIIGATGYTGSAIAAEAARRGHYVTGVARSVPLEPVPGVTYLQGTALSGDVRARAFEGADVVITATSPRADMADQHTNLMRLLMAQAIEKGTRLVVVGGFSSLRPSAGEARFIEGTVDERFRNEALAGHASLEMLLDAPPELDWTFVSPAAKFGAHAQMPARGEYRLGGDVALFDEDGESSISAEDFALGVVDLVESGDHRREHVSLAY